MRILGVIPARGGSKRIPRKNLQIVGGRMLIEWACMHAHHSHLLDSWVVSTDDEGIARYIEGIWCRGAHTRGPHLLRRPPELALDDTPMAPVLLHAAEATGGNWDAVVTIQPTSPLRTARDIDRAIATWLDEDCYEYVVSVNADTKQRNGAVYVCRMGDSVLWDEDHTGHYEMPAARSLDINTPEDLEEARRILGP